MIANALASGGESALVKNHATPANMTNPVIEIPAILTILATGIDSAFAADLGIGVFSNTVGKGSPQASQNRADSSVCAPQRVQNLGILFSISAYDHNYRKTHHPP
ncbi:MAG: hypothetical protein ABL868_02235 [Sulfuriferula sp.]